MRYLFFFVLLSLVAGCAPKNTVDYGVSGDSLHSTPVRWEVKIRHEF